MEAQIKAALALSDYPQVSRLLKQWQAEEPSNPLLRLYAAQMQEKTNRLEVAEKNYLGLLKQAPGHKVMSQARAGLARIHQQQQAQKAEALSQAKQIEGGNEMAVLAIASPSPAQRQQAINGLAKVFSLDAYTARMKLPTSGFRLYRVGPWGEVSYYAKALERSHVPTLSTKVNDIKSLQTFQISYFETLPSQGDHTQPPQPTIICKNSEGQLGKISFDWSEVSQQVSAQLPIFEQVVDIGNWGKTVHKEKVQDYTQVVDFHLPGRQIILRLCDRLYQYQKGISLSTRKELNSRIQWNQLLSKLNPSTQTPHHNNSYHNNPHHNNPHHKDFARFEKGALEFLQLLPPIPPNLNIDRRAPSHCDQAFHLYSSLCYFNGLSAADAPFS